MTSLVTLENKALGFPIPSTCENTAEAGGMPLTSLQCLNLGLLVPPDLQEINPCVFYS